MKVVYGYGEPEEKLLEDIDFCTSFSGRVSGMPNESLYLKCDQKDVSTHLLDLVSSCLLCLSPNTPVFNFQEVEVEVSVKARESFVLRQIENSLL